MSFDGYGGGFHGTDGGRIFEGPGYERELIGSWAEQNEVIGTSVLYIGGRGSNIEPDIECSE